MCRVLKVARAGFYVWLHNPVSAGEKDNQRLLELIRDSYTLSGGVYGYRRVHGDLREIGEVCSRNRVAKIMRKNRIQAIHGYKVPRGSRGRPSLIAPNHVRREFTVVKPNQGKRLVRTVLIFTESSDQLSRATDRVPGLPASPGYVQ